jgi:hypothetical protein
MALVRPVFLVDNLFNPVHYPDVTLSANEEASGHEAEFFSTLRREDSWSPTTFNADSWMKARHAQVRAFNTVILWVHNLLGEAYKFQISNDDFVSTPETVIDVTIPSNPGTGHIDDALGVVTEDLMWVKRVPTRYAADFRHFVPAMGANQKPELAGIAGSMYSPNQYDYPYAPSTTTLLVEEHMSDRGVRGHGTLAAPRHGEIVMKMRNDFDYELARFHLEHLWGGWEASPMLIVHNEAQAERAVMAVRTGGSMLGFETDSDWPDGGEGRSKGRLSFAEHDPLGVG